jgi:hypothetical protein
MVQESACFSPEGSFDHNRYGSLCLLTMIGTSTNKTADHYVCKCQKQNVRANTVRYQGTERGKALTE